MTQSTGRPMPAWDPFAELQALRAELSRLVGGRSSTNDIDVDETAAGWTVTARLPGVAPDEVMIELDERELAIRAKSEAEVNAGTDGEAAGSRRRSFDYRVTVPGEVDPDTIDATMDHGLLTVRLPRTARTQRRQIAVGRGQRTTDSGQRPVESGQPATET